MNTLSSLIQKYRMYGFRTFVVFVLYELRLRLMRLLRGSYSQNGEDLVIDRLLGHMKKGFYVDVGASDPLRFNNTKRFSKRGWTGINIEPDPDKHARLLKNRPNDINLNIGIGLENSSMTFYRFFPDSVSTFSEEMLPSLEKAGFHLVEGIPVEVRKLGDVLAEHRGQGQIDFMSIDTEGFDLEVLQSNNWDVFRPKLICVELAREGLETSSDEEIRKIERLLEGSGYVKVWNNVRNQIFTLEKRA